MVLKPAGKIAIALLLILLGVFAYKHFMPSGKASPPITNNRSTDNTINNTGTANGSSNNADRETTTQGSTSGTSNASHTESRAFNYTPDKPVNGILKGVVEVGATGFNSFVINMDNEKRWEIVSKDFGQSLAYEGLMTTDDIRTGLKKYIAAMFDKGVSSRNIHFAISSGAQKEPKTATITSELKKMGYVVNLVTAEQEGKYALKATIPPSFVESSFMTDIGSGNTKVSWNEGGNLKSLETAGSKYYERNMTDDAVYTEVKSQLNRVPENKRNVCFIIGGFPFSLAKQTRKGEERYTVLNPPASYTASDKKMAAGLNIYKAIADATKCDTFVFDWDANFTIGFLLSLP